MFGTHSNSWLIQLVTKQIFIHPFNKYLSAFYVLGFLQLDSVALSLYHMLPYAGAVTSAMVIKRQIKQVLVLYLLTIW